MSGLRPDLNVCNPFGVDFTFARCYMMSSPKEKHTTTGGITPENIANPSDTLKGSYNSVSPVSCQSSSAAKEIHEYLAHPPISPVLSMYRGESRKGDEIEYA